MKKLYAFLKCIAIVGMGTDLASTYSPALAANAVRSATNGSVKAFIVTLRREADQDGLVKEHGVHRHCAYHHAFNGFAPVLDSGQVEKLKHDPRVIAVEPDGKVRLCAQHCPFLLECTL